ncbi:hypothetical protein HK405_011013, partial [Cladochytrium tenue]
MDAAAVASDSARPNGDAVVERQVREHGGAGLRGVVTKGDARRPRAAPSRVDGLLDMPAAKQSTRAEDTVGARASKPLRSTAAHSPSQVNHGRTDRLVSTMFDHGGGGLQTVAMRLGLRGSTARVTEWASSNDRAASRIRRRWRQHGGSAESAADSSDVKKAARVAALGVKRDGGVADDDNSEAEEAERKALFPSLLWERLVAASALDARRPSVQGFGNDGPGRNAAAAAAGNAVGADGWVALRGRHGELAWPCISGARRRRYGRGGDGTVEAAAAAVAARRLAAAARLLAEARGVAALAGNDSGGGDGEADLEEERVAGGLGSEIRRLRRRQLAAVRMLEAAGAVAGTARMRDGRRVPTREEGGE